MRNTLEPASGVRRNHRTLYYKRQYVGTVTGVGKEVIVQESTEHGDGRPYELPVYPDNFGTILKIDSICLTTYQENNLSDTVDKISVKSAVDYTNCEFQDIQTATYRMIEKAVTRMNKRGVFKIARIEPCGSMAEKISV